MFYVQMIENVIMYISSCHIRTGIGNRGGGLGTTSAKKMRISSKFF